MNTITEILRHNRFTPEDLPAFEGKLFFEGARRRPYRVRFAVLLFLSTVIATYGVINDSDATVIGAMIIAPLMTPILGTAAALVMGDMERASRSVAIVAAGIALVLVTACLIGLSYHGIISYTDNSQIISRVSPRLTDLAIALAAGAAGAFAMSRDDIADSLPGVAISISLVPPLCVAGLSAAGGEWALTQGAFLLFATNFLSIVLAGGGVFALLNLSGAATRTLEGHARRNAFTVVAIGVIAVSVPLAATSYRTGRLAMAERQTTLAARDWVDGTTYEVRSVTATSEGVTVLLAGKGEMPSPALLVNALRSGSAPPDIVELEIVPFETQQYAVVTLPDS